MKTQLPPQDSLFAFIQNAEMTAELEAQIEAKEQDIQCMSALILFYETMGFDYMIPAVAERCNKDTEELLLLQLKKNSLERHAIEFQLKALCAD